MHLDDTCVGKALLSSSVGWFSDGLLTSRSRQGSCPAAATVRCVTRSRAQGRSASIRLFLLACLGAAALATLGGVLFWAIHGGTTPTRAIAYGFWVAATLTLLARAVSGSRWLARRGLPQVDGWVFVTAAFVLTGIGAVVDALGSA